MSVANVKRSGRSQNGNEEIAYSMLWSGKAYSPEEAKEAQAAKAKYAKAA
ncbi:hypothetical protein [Sulfuritortus calidifontis]|nr:hypothetical protein [Sulfuritortus calidifontis]